MKKNGAGQSLFLALLISMGLFFFVQGKQLIESGASPVIFIAFSAFAGIIGWSSSNNEAASAQSHGTNQNQKIKKPTNLKQEDWSVFCLS